MVYIMTKWYLSHDCKADLTFQSKWEKNIISTDEENMWQNSTLNHNRNWMEYPPPD